MDVDTEDVMLSNSVTVAKYLQFEAEKDREKIVKFFILS